METVNRKPRTRKPPECYKDFEHLRSTIAEFFITFKTKGATRKPIITTSRDTAAILKEQCFINGEWCESFVVMALTRSNRVIGFYPISTGGQTGTVADPRKILQFALLANATSLILSHNHPSGSLRPSRQDEELTRKIKDAANFHDIKVLDHIIITDGEYFSFADEGLI